MRCRLCLKEAALQDSHLLPRSAYRYLRMLGPRGNLDPIFLSANKLLQTSRQVKEYLLCSDCEDRFNNRGERWCLRNCDRGQGRFGLRKILASHVPRWDHNGFQVYDGVDMADVDVESLAYFGLSVFWRAAVHRWKTPDGTVKIDLGPYEEPLRRFLLDEVLFPGKILLTVRVSDLGNVMWTPVQKNSAGFHSLTFGMLGLVFNLAVGSKIPHEFYSLATVPNSRKLLWRVRNQDDFLFAEATKMYRSAIAAKP